MRIQNITVLEAARYRASASRAAIIAILVAGAVTFSPAQSLNGKPDVSGLWQADRTPKDEYTAVLGHGFTDIQPDLHDITKNVINVFWGMKPEDEPLRKGRTPST